MTTNRKLEIVAGIGGIAVGLATGGIVPAAVGTIGAAVSSLALLFRDKPETKATKLKRAKATVASHGQATDDEDPK